MYRCVSTPVSRGSGNVELELGNCVIYNDSYVLYVRGFESEGSDVKVHLVEYNDCGEVNDEVWLKLGGITWNSKARVFQTYDSYNF